MKTAHYSQAPYGDDSVMILKNGVKMEISEIINELNCRVHTDENLNVDINKFGHKTIKLVLPRARIKIYDTNSRESFIKVSLGYLTDGHSFSFRTATETGVAYDAIVNALIDSIEHDVSTGNQSV